VKKKFVIDRCCDCPFNDHGQERPVPIMHTYLGLPIQIYWGTSFGGPQLECWYDPKKDLRANVRGRSPAKLNFIIWRSSWYDGTEIEFDFTKQREFREQLTGFPKRCPLKNE